MSSNDISDILSICLNLEKRIDRITNSSIISTAPHFSPDDMKRAVTQAGDSHDLRLLRAYEQYLSANNTPHMIKSVIAALGGGEEYDQNNTSDAVFEMLSPVQLDSYRKVFSALHSDHPSWTPMAQTAARHPELTDQIIEQAVRGVVEPREALASIRSDD